MATKPTETLNFEPPDTAGADTITVIVPTDKQAAGFLSAEKPPAQYVNWLFRTLSRLYNYVKDGNFTGNHTITGTFGVSGLITASAGVTAAVNQNVTLSGTGDYLHGTRKRWQGVQRGTTETSITYLADRITASSSPASVSMPAPCVTVGDSITALHIRLLGSGPGQNATAVLKRANGDGTVTDVGTVTITSPITSWVTYSFTLPSAELVADVVAYYWLVTMSSSSMAFSNVGISFVR